ncbi:hypothetical protein ACFE04_021082 [Oxalis oulophora]
MNSENESQPPPQQEEQLIAYLPNDAALNILSRIPRVHHPKLSLVSKPFRSIIASPFFFSTRHHLNATEPCLYLCLRLSTTTTAAAASRHFYTLHQNPISKKRSLSLIATHPLSLIGSAFVTVGPKIYVIGGSINDVSSSHVRTLDCRFHTWGEVPNMRIGREFAAAGVVEDKIYVIGGCVVDNWARSRFWAEVFDTKTQTWGCIPSSVDVKEKWMHASAVVDGKLYAMADRGGVKYDPKNDSWETVEKRLDLGWRGRACVIDGVLYCYDYLGKVRGFDGNKNVWKELRGLDKALPNFLCGAAMANCGGKLMLAWEGKNRGRAKEMEIWCAEIEVEINREGELLGKIDWVEMVLTVPTGSHIITCLAVTL